MQVRVRLFASLRESVGRERLELELPDGASVEEAWRSLASRHPALEVLRPSLAAAVNRSYAGFDAPLADGDEVAFIPPVSGGAG
jgi:molybdopterin converting factor subunit 1